MRTSKNIIIKDFQFGQRVMNNGMEVKAFPVGNLKEVEKFALELAIKENKGLKYINDFNMTRTYRKTDGTLTFWGHMINW